MLIARSQGVKDEACQRLLGFSSWEAREHTPVIHQLSCFNVPGTAPCCYGKACRFFSHANNLETNLEWHT